MGKNNPADNLKDIRHKTYFNSETGSAAGKRSAESKAEAKKTQELVKNLLDMSVSKKFIESFGADRAKGETFAQLLISRGQKDLTIKEIGAIRQVAKYIDGDPDAYSRILAIIGEKPTEKVTGDLFLNGLDVVINVAKKD